MVGKDLTSLEKTRKNKTSGIIIHPLKGVITIINNLVCLHIDVCFSFEMGLYGVGLTKI